MEPALSPQEVRKSAMRALDWALDRRSEGSSAPLTVCEDRQRGRSIARPMWRRDAPARHGAGSRRESVAAIAVPQIEIAIARVERISGRTSVARDITGAAAATGAPSDQGGA